MNTKELALMANSIRLDVVRMVAGAHSGHLGGALGMADVFAVLFFDILRHRPGEPEWSDRDYFFLSNGHICAAYYASLAHAGYFPLSELATFRKMNSRLQGHPHLGSLPGIEGTSGPLGQGISQAIGASLALRMDKRKNNVFVFSGDGELEEGQVWEAALFAGHHKLGNYVHIIDRNHIQIDGTTGRIIGLEPLAAKFRSFEYYVLEMNAHDIDQIRKTLRHAVELRSKPVVVIANSIPGKGVSFMERRSEWHGKVPNNEQTKQALVELEAERRNIHEGYA